MDVSEDGLAQLTGARAEIDTLVTRLAIADGDIAWEADVVAKHHSLVRVSSSTTSPEISQEWLEAHEAFHVAILRGSQNAYLVEIASRLRSISVVYRAWSAPAAKRTHRDLAREHREVMEAVIARDPDRAARLTESHIRRTTELLISGRYDVTVNDG